MEHRDHRPFRDRVAYFLASLVSRRVVILDSRLYGCHSRQRVLLLNPLAYHCLNLLVFLPLSLLVFPLLNLLAYLPLRLLEYLRSPR